MTAPIPVPKIPNSNRRVREDFNNNNSVVSLPHAPSMRSTATGFSDNHYDVGTIDVFSPRPTIRYSMNSPMASGALRSAGPSRTETRRDEDEDPRRILRESRTIDDLADRYDATTVRDLMERDAKRRERRKKDQDDKARRRLERHAARERGEPVPPSRGKRRARSPRTEMAEHQRRERERETGLSLSGVDATTNAPRSPTVPKSPLENARPAHDDKAVKDTEDLSQQNPFNDPASEGNSPMDEPVVSTAEAIRYSTASVSPPGSPRASVHQRKTSSISQITDLHASSNTNLAGPSPDRRLSETAARRGGPLAALLRGKAPMGRGTTDRPRGGTFEPSFSNTSRESMRGQPPPAHLRDERRGSSRSGTPTRTMSKFREDLPEYKLTPSPSWEESPADLPPPPSLLKGKLPESPLQQALIPQEDATVRNDSMGSTRMLSQSLASVDSEGSWLSGKPAKRSSQQMTPQMLSEKPEFRGSYEDLGVTDEEYFRRQATAERKPGLGGIQAALRGDSRTGETAGGEEEQITRGDVSRKPTVIQQEGRKKSIEGLLNRYEEGESATIETESQQASPTSAGTEGSPIDDLDSPIKPVLGHARSVSRGSAKLLEIPSRRSTPAVSPNLKQGEFEEPKEEK